jgi:hypothetical protein
MSRLDQGVFWNYGQTILQVVHMLEKSINDSAVDQSDIAKKIEKLEGTQIDLVHLCEEVRISTDELAKSAAIWYPKYEAAACIVSELSFKLEQTDEKIREIYCDENLLQHMAQLSESKVQGLKDMVSSSVLAQCRPQLQNILEQVENENLAHRQVNLHTCGMYTSNCSVFHYPFSDLS